jgi:hypothetical protein
MFVAQLHRSYLIHYFSSLDVLDVNLFTCALDAISIIQGTCTV